MLIYNSIDVGTGLSPDEMVDILFNTLVLPVKREYPNFDTLRQEEKDTIIIATVVNFVGNSVVNVEDVVGVDNGRIRDYVAYVANNILIALSESFIINHSRYKTIVNNIVESKFNFVLNTTNPVNVQLGFYKILPDEMATAIKDNVYIYSSII